MLTGGIQLNKHDKYVQRLYEQIQDNYDQIYTHIPLYSKRKRLIGEIDLLAVKDNQVDIFEVKCSPRSIKAKRQLNKIKKHLDIDNARTFFFCGLNNAINIII